MGAEVDVQVRDAVAYVTLSRPEAMNGITEEVLGGLEDACARVAGDGSVKAAVITGAGTAFCVGLDIGLLGRAFEHPDYFESVLRRYRSILLTIERLPVPVVAAVNGLTRAGGLELLLACDVAIAADEVRIADHHLAFGIVPGGGATQRLPRRIGRPAARDLIFTARWIDGAEAVGLGLVLRSVPVASLASEVESYVDVFRPRSRAALAATKAAMNEGESLPIDRAVDVEIDHFMRYLRNDLNAAEGYRAFVEGRDPVWPS